MHKHYNFVAFPEMIVGKIWLFGVYLVKKLLDFWKLPKQNWLKCIYLNNLAPINENQMLKI